MAWYLFKEGTNFTFAFVLNFSFIPVTRYGHTPSYFCMYL